VALSLTVFGCAGQVEIDRTPSNDSDPTPDQPPIDPADDPTLSGMPGMPQNDPPIHSELACQAEPPGQVVDIDAEQLTCCVDLLAPVVPINGEGWDVWTSDSTDPDVQGCCNVLIANVDADWNNAELLGYEAVSACCQAIGSPTGPACTPWGPPAPPIFDPELARLWEVA
jgi:hypothetical protein